jgi:hypothetical protein
MYFSLIPDIKYDEKPIKFPFSEAEFVTAKNFFRRFKIDEDVFSYSVFFKKYNITDSDRLDLLAEKAYGSPYYDWVIILTNNMINPAFDWPLKEWQLRNAVENPDDTHHHETLEVKNSEGVTVLKEGLIVDSAFANKPFKYLDKSTPSLIYTTKTGEDVTLRVTNLDQALKENDAKREIYLLRPEYVESFVNAFRKQNLYFRSSNYIDSQLKKTG